MLLGLVLAGVTVGVVRMTNTTHGFVYTLITLPSGLVVVVMHEVWCRQWH